MVWLLTMWLFAIQTEVPVDTVPLPRLATNVFAYLDRPVRTCGLLQAKHEGQPSEHILHVSAEGEGSWFYVDAGTTNLPPYGSRICLNGFIRRRDGLTPRQLAERGIGVVAGEDGLQNPDYVFYATRVDRQY